MSDLTRRLADRWARAHNKKRKPPASARGRRKPGAKGPKTQCVHGHPLTPENLRIGIQHKNGREYVKRECRQCARDRERLRYRKDGG